MFKWIRNLLIGATVAGSAYVGVTQYAASPPEEVYLIKGLTHYIGDYPFGIIKERLEKDGYKVTVLNHTDGKRLEKLPAVMVAHSMGANAALKAINRFGDECVAKHKKVEDRIACFKDNLPRLVISIDAGRYPLYSYAPRPDTTRCVSLYDPAHPIGGQKIYPHSISKHECENYVIKGTVHSSMPTYDKVVEAVIRTIKENK